MLDLFFKLVDYVVVLIRGRITDRSALFKEVVEPFFNQVQPVVDDVFVQFRAVRDLLERDTDDWQAAVAEVRRRRELLLTARRSTMQMARTVIRSTTHEGLISFAREVSWFLAPKKPREFESRTHSLLRFMDEVGTFTTREQALHQVEWQLAWLEELWDGLALAYAELRVECLTPDRHRSR